MTRVFVCVLDGCGAGALPDAAAYGDEGSDTLRHVLERSDVPLPNLVGLGLAEVVGLPLGAPRADATYGRLVERGAGKDTTTGHWEMMGVVLERPFPTYPDGFPPEVIDPFEAAVGRQVLCNRPASGTGIIEELGDEHVATGRPIVYTSADSVFQIACHEDVVPVDGALRVVRDRSRDPARSSTPSAASSRGPFAGASGHYARTPRRRDFSLAPPGPTYLDLLHERGVPVVGVGKIGEIFVQRGVDVDDHTTDNSAGIAACARHLREMEDGLLFANLVDFDSVWGHRNDVDGFADGLAAVDAALPVWEGLLPPGGRDHPVRRSRRRPDHGEHRSLARVLAAARAGARTRPLRRRPGGRGRDGLRTPDGGGAAAPRTSDRLMAGPADDALRRVAAWRPHAAVVYGSGLCGAAATGRASRTSCPTRRSGGRAPPCPATRTCSGWRPCPRRGRRELRLALACGRPHRYEGWDDRRAGGAGARARRAPA